MIDAQVLAFAGIAALLTIAPGPDTMLVVRNVVARGRRAGCFTALGICSGLFLHAALSAAGLSLILVRSAAVFEAVKLAGAVYLVWLGIGALRQALFHPIPAKAAIVGASWGSGSEAWRSAVEGLLCNALNPKVAVFYLAFLPQFIGPEDPVFIKSLLLAAIHWAEGLAWLSLVAYFLSRLRGWHERPQVQRVINGAMGAILVAFGVRLVFDRR